MSFAGSSKTFFNSEIALEEDSTRVASKDSFDSALDNVELGLLSEDGSRDTTYLNDPNVSAPLWPATTAKDKWILFWKKLWIGPRNPEDVPARFGNRHLARFESLPTKLKATLSFKYKLIFCVLYFALWLWVDHSLLAPPLTTAPGYSENGKDSVAVSLSCNNEPSFWKGKNAACGLNGERCEPFVEREVVFRCPALCDRGSWTYSSIPVGDQSIKYQGFFIGGGKLNQPTSDGELTHPYRSDSFPCGAAIHSGILSPFLGGCAKIRYVGSQSSFPSVSGHYGVSDSVGFDSFFPSSFVFVELENSWNCYDPRIVVTVINIFFGFPVIYLFSGIAAFWTVTTVAFWTICLALDPPVIVNVLDPESLPTLISLALERFLPTIFILYTLWRFAIRNTLTTQETTLAKTLLWYPLFWLGVLNNVTFDRLPVDRLDFNDLKEQSGAIFAVGGIAGTILICAIVQAYKLWKTGKFRTYLYIYLTFIAGLFFISRLNGLTLRIHHYILAMLLIPGTGTKGFTAMLFQGLLVGLFLSGTARWGLASIAETTRALKRQDPTGAVVPPVFESYSTDSKLLSWIDKTKNLPDVIDGEIQHPSDQLTGYSLLINDIERYQGDDNSLNLEMLMSNNGDLKKLVNDSLKDNDEVKLYLRLAKSSLSTRRRSDYTRAAILKWPSGEFTKPEPGLT